MTANLAELAQRLTLSPAEVRYRVNREDLDVWRREGMPMQEAKRPKVVLVGKARSG